MLRLETQLKTILAQFDTDVLPSSFDRVVAVDSNVEQLFSYGSVAPDNVTGLVHGLIFTRGPADLKHSAIFIGGSDVGAGEALLRKVTKTFFGPMRVSVMMDSNGCNTTAAAAIASARKHLNLVGCRAIVLGATGPVGLRAAELLAAGGGASLSYQEHWTVWNRHARQFVPKLPMLKSRRHVLRNRMSSKHCARMRR